MVKKINEQIEYRKASKEDVSAVLEVEKVNYGDEALSIIYIKDCLEMYSDSFYVALINNKIVGFCIGLSSRSEEKGWISALNTLKGYEGKGIGSTLTKIIVAKLESLGSKSVRLTAKHDMVSFYENLDFQISGEKREDYYGFGEDRFYMKKNTEKI